MRWKICLVCGLCLTIFFGVFYWNISSNHSKQKAPKNPLAICEIFRMHPAWYRSAHAVQHHYHVPISLQMAIIYQESRFHASAEPKREHLFGWIPWFRESTAEGYSQALDDTWRYYLRETNQLSANRAYFSDSVAFIGWYINRIHHYLHIPITDVYRLYLAYHEGIHGYRERTYANSPYLKHIAHKVANVAWHYHVRLLQCGYSEYFRKKKPHHKAHA